MKPHFHRVMILILAASFLCACDLRTNPIPTDTPIPPSATQTKTSTSLPSVTSTFTTTITPKPSSTLQPTPQYFPVDTLAASLTPVPGWMTYTNGYLGYSFNYPLGAKIDTHGPGSMDLHETIPPGFTSDGYFDYVMTLLPADLCVSVEIPGAMITIVPPYDPIGSYVAPCPGMGIGSQFIMKRASESWWIAGKTYKDSQGFQLFLKSTNEFYGEAFIFDLQNGFRVIYNGMPRTEMSAEEYQAQKSLAHEIIVTLNWFRVPDLTKPGTTCAGSYTRLLPGTRAIVTGLPGDPPDRVRAEPRLDGQVISQVYPQTIITIAEGPQCADGLVFWKVEHPLIPGGSGWTAEGDGTDYWLEPYRH